MEYLMVKFAESRNVIVDEIKEGKTNQVLELEAGSHLVTLDGSPDFSPEFSEFILRNTSELCPKVIDFEKT
jgi:hypothetical protein